MEEEPTRGRLKRPLPVDDDSGSDKAPMKKKVRFPKGKKVKPGEEKVDVWKGSEDSPADRAKARLVAKERAMRRNQINAELFSDENRGMLQDITAAEEHYEENETFVDDGIQIEPFNLEKEREEGYFDADGNFVEYVDDNEIKDAWLDNVEVDLKLAEKGLKVTNNENEDDIIDDLSSEEIGKIKRRIADVLEPGETVLRALRRLKGTSNNKKEKMSAETQLVFDQLTEDAMKLMENGDYNVYEEKKEVFEREAEGYERLARAREETSSFDLGQVESSSTVANDFVEILPSNGDDTFDMFADDDEHATANPTSDGNNLGSGPNNDRSGQSSENGSSQYDYVYDESSGYYYSSSLGYFYDPSSGLYCCAASGQWYSYNEVTGSYDGIQEAASNIS